MDTAPRIENYIFKEFIKRFIPALLVLFFIFVLQTFWVYFDELAGKGLSLKVIFKFFYYFSPNIFLYALPLSVLLAGIMTYGAMGEKNELAAIKSAGVSMVTSMRKILIFSIFLLIFVFVFVNTVQPKGNYKFTQLRVSIARKMPAAVIREGIFSNIGDFSIKVGEKYGEDDRKLKDVIIHQKIEGLPDKVIIAKEGEFLSDEASGLLTLKLYDGEFFEDLTRRQKKSSDRKQLPALYSKFRQYDLNIDISDMNTLKESKTQMRLYHMLNMKQLRQFYDSLETDLAQEKQNFRQDLIDRHYFSSGTKTDVTWKDIEKSLKLTPSDWNRIYSRARAEAQTNITFLKRKTDMFRRKQTFINKYRYSFHSKIATPFYIFLLLLVGIPLGAMIRKGGFGLPFVLGIAIYAAFYMLSMLGKSMAEEGIIPAWLGAWLPVLVLLPPVLYMIYAVQRIPEVKWFNRVKTWIGNKWPSFGRKVTHNDAIFIPGVKYENPSDKKIVQTYPLQKGSLVYREHEGNLEKLLNYLQDLIRQTGAEYILAYWRPPDEVARRFGLLGEVLMLKVVPGGVEHATTDLDVNYKYENGAFRVWENAPYRFIHYKDFR